VSLFPFLEVLTSDPIREVHQGIGWYLREAWKLNPEATKAFLLRWKIPLPCSSFNMPAKK
jgi:3-methyladenine DNA glycosylase AlkD